MVLGNRAQPWGQDGWMDKENSGAAAGRSLLEVRDLAVCFRGEVEALRGVTLSLERGESLAIVGESGSGKSTLAHCLAGLVQPPEATGSVRVQGVELLGAPEAALRSVRWSTVALALQGAPFNPVVTIGDQIAEPLRERLGMGARPARARAAALAEDVLLDPALLDRHPHELSGGQRRRAALAMRSEEHTSELQSPDQLVCRLLLRRPPASPLFPYTTLFRSFNPVVTIGDQIAEPLRERLGMGARPARARAAALAEDVLLDPALLDRHPHELSGGQRRRAALAM